MLSSRRTSLNPLSMCGAKKKYEDVVASAARSPRSNHGSKPFVEVIQLSDAL
jgi:hypothetical protein